MTLQEFLTKLEGADPGSPLILSLTDSELPDVGIEDVAIIDNGDGTHYLEVQVKHPDVLELVRQSYARLDGADLLRGDDTP